MRIGEKIYTAAEASKILGGVVSPRTLHDRAVSGKYPHIGGRKYGGGRIGFAESHLQTIADSLEHTPAAADPEAAAKTLINAANPFRYTARSSARH